MTKSPTACSIKLVPQHIFLDVNSGSFTLIHVLAFLVFRNVTGVTYNGNIRAFTVAAVWNILVHLFKWFVDADNREVASTIPRQVVAPIDRNMLAPSNLALDMAPAAIANADLNAGGVIIADSNTGATFIQEVVSRRGGRIVVD